VTTDQYNEAAKIVADDRKTTPEYVFLKFNCTDWAYKVGKAAGMKLPPAGALVTGVYDPERVATAQHDDATLDPGGELHVKLTGFDGDEAITAVRWGDNEADYQGRVFSHTYKAAGTYRVTGVALAKQNVQRFAIVVHVSDGGDREARVGVEIPTGAAQVDRAPRLVEGPPVAQLPA
jgi:hypothetical protein